MSSESADKSPIVVPVTKWPGGPIIGQATLTPTESDGIFLMQVEIEGYPRSGTGFMHFPIPEGFKPDNLYVKDNRDGTVQDRSVS
jgi:hypothetical protein